MTISTPPHDLPNDTASSNLEWWAVVRTHPSREAIAMTHLEQQGYSCYLPQIVRRVQAGRRRTNKPRPMFPGYVFLKWPKTMSSWRSILSTRGVKMLICMGNMPALIEGSFIDGLRRRELNGVVVLPETQFTPGDRVILSGGPFDGVIAHIVNADDKHRLTILMQLLQRQVKIQVDTTQTLVTKTT